MKQYNEMGAEIERLEAQIAAKDAEIAKLRSELKQWRTEWPELVAPAEIARAALETKP